MKLAGSWHCRQHQFARKTEPIGAYRGGRRSDARRHFLARLAVETDPSDLVHDLTRGTGRLVVLDVRSAADFELCHIPGARSLPHRQISEETTADIEGCPVEGTEGAAAPLHWRYDG